MKNEIGRKLTSLTIMAIMFAGGMTFAVPSLMPESAADFGATDGLLSVSSTIIQGAAILEITVNDPDISDTSIDIASGATVSIGGTSYDMVQAANGKWYLYVVDTSISDLLDADSTGLEFGIKCTTGLGIAGSAAIIASGTNVWAAAVNITPQTAGGGCLNIDNTVGTTDNVSGTTSRQDLTAAVLQAAPALSDHNDAATDLGQRGHKLNASGYGSWPYILSIELQSDNAVEYGGDGINVEYGNAGDYTDISLVNQNPSDNTEIHLSITDPALNIDPTAADVWLFDLNAAASASSVIFANNGTSNTAMAPSELAQHGCVDNCVLTANVVTSIAGVQGDTTVMTETGANTGVFESWDLNGVSQISTVDQATGDAKTVFTYNAQSIDMIITYNSATLDLDAGGDWSPATSADITITDPDLNKNPSSDETLEIGNSTHTIPTIKVGSPLTLAGGNNPNMEAGDSTRGSTVSGSSTSSGAGIKIAGTTVGSDTGGNMYGLNVYNTTDNSERLRIIHNGTEGSGGDQSTTTWINVTTGHTRADLVNLAGTVVLNYDVSGPGGLMDSTAVSVYVTDDGDNGTDNAAGLLDLVTSGNARTGVVDLDDATHTLEDRDNTAVVSWSGPSHANSNYVTVNFKFTHAAGDRLDASEDYAIAADFCNFDQQNSSLTHNCIYRLEASETGADTGVFSGTVEYITLNNSTSGDSHGEHDGSDREVENLMTGMNGDALIVILMDGVSGSDSVRVVYNDTDALQQVDKLGAQLETSTHTGTASLDAGDYEAADMATITIVDADLNQDSAIRDTYENSSSTFKMTVTGSTGTAHQPFATKPMTVIETTADSGIFVGTFKVPDYNGQDMELTYYESKDSGGNAVEFYDTATISSNTGSISLDKSVYPVPFGAADLREGDGGQTGQDESGNVTMTITVSDPDFTDDTLTTTSTTSAGAILVKLIEGATTSTCFTAGSSVASTDTGAGKPSTTAAQELGPLSVTETGSGTYEVGLTIDEIQHCGSNMRTVTSGDIIQVEYVDTSDDNGNSVTVYDSSTFDLRTGSLSVDKDVYVLGSDMVVTLTDPDLNLDGGTIETYNMSLLEWDSDAASSQLLDNEGITTTNANSFTSNPSSLTETGSDTGVFQTVVTLPTAQVSSTTIDYGEAVTLTYVDVGLSGEDSTEDDTLDVEAYFSISNFGALIELDKAVYGWKDTVYITITSPDHNVNSASEEQIGTTALPIQVTTRSGKMCSGSTYLADESGPDTGVFEAEVLLTGFDHTMSSDSTSTTATTSTCGSSSTDGKIKTASQTDGVSVSYEYNDATVVVASASVQWNIAEASFDSSAVSAGGSAVLTVVDSDENLNNAIIDAFTVDVYSDSDNGGFKLTMAETDENTGVFEGTVYFTTATATSGTNIRVSEGDTVTAEYTDETLPEPYTTSDDLVIAATTTVGTAFPPLERAPAANARVVDAFGSSVAEVTVDQQVQIAADVSNGQSGDQAFAYLVQVQDGDGVTVSLAWITGSLTAGQSMSPALSWTPDAAGSYTATVFVWESVDNPTALSPTVSVSIDVV